jgi:hypothetical protein
MTVTVDLLKSFTQNRVFTPEGHHKLIEKLSRKGKFSVTAYSDNFCTEYKWWWPKFYKKTPSHYISLVKLCPEPRKLIFPFHSAASAYSSGYGPWPP